MSAWAVEGNVDADAARSIEFEMEWPPRSGRRASFPEVERAAWFHMEEALVKLNPAQTSFVRQLAEKLSVNLS